MFYDDVQEISRVMANLETANAVVSQDYVSSSGALMIIARAQSIGKQDKDQLLGSEKNKLNNHLQWLMSHDEAVKEGYAGDIEFNQDIYRNI